MRLGEAAALRVVGVVVLLRGAVPSAVLATRLGRHTVALELLLVFVASGATAVWVAMPVVSPVVLEVASFISVIDRSKSASC